MEDSHMESMDNFRERFEALEQRTEHLQQHTRTIERRLRWWRGMASGVLILSLGMLGLLLFPTLVQSAGPNLVVNGDFSLGNTGFTSGYVFTSDTTPEGTYCVDTNPHNCHPGGASYGDHTSGT